MLNTEQIQQITERAGIHSSLGQDVPNDLEQKKFYGMLEILDFECCKYGDAPEGVTEADIKAYLIENKNRIKVEAISSYLGLLAGAFNFLKES